MSKTACLSLLFVIFLFSSCTKTVSFDVKTPGIKNGVFIIKDDKGAMIYSANIQNGAVKLDSKLIEQIGYFTLNITSNDSKNIPAGFEIYLTPGKYTIETSPFDNYIYPNITAPCLEQQELTAYYTLASTLKYERVQLARKYNRQLKAGTPMDFNVAKFKNLVNDVKLSEVHSADADKDALELFLKRYPQSITAAHIMSHLDYEADPSSYYKIFNRLSSQTRNSEEGKYLGDRLSKLAALVQGGQAPIINGYDPNGKKFSVSNYKKKIYLLEFWKAGNELSRINHSQPSMANMLGNIPDKKNFGIISVSLDSKRDWWTSAITDDKLTWPQYSDLKGNESINASNWGITRIPMYYLVDENWHIVDRDIMPAEIPVVINQYLKRH